MVSDKEKLLEVIHRCDGSLEQILEAFMLEYSEDFSPSRLSNLIDLVNCNLKQKLVKQEQSLDIAYERASYIEAYLSGKMYNGIEAAISNAPIQLNNAITIKDTISKCRR